MSFELVYTSARKGLRVGASGFCTVAATEGIPRTLQDKLESLSGYRHEESFAGLEPPVNYSHSTLRIQRRIYHVFSRVGSAAKDHTRRSNKIAHHLALTSSELTGFPDGPVSLFSDVDFWFDDWNSDPTHLGPGRLPTAMPGQVDGFDTWERVFDDPGWAGVLGEAISDGFKSVSVIVPENDVALDLLAEALQLVKPEDRWKVCFSTYYSRQVSGAQCHWRVALEGTSEARKLRARTQGLLVDPLGPAPRLPDNAFVQAARDGQPERVHELVSPADRRRISIRQDALKKDGEEELDEPRVRPSVRRRQEARQRQKQPLESRSPFDVDESEYAHVSIGSAKEEANSSRRRKRRRKKRSPAAVGVLALGVAVILILAYLGFKLVS